MSKTKTKRKISNGKPGPAELVEAIQRKAGQLGSILGTLPEKQLAEVSKRLEAAWEALQASAWRDGVVQGEIVKVLDLKRHHFESWGEAHAVEVITDNIIGVMNDRYAPAEYAGKVPSAAAVRDCVRAWQRGTGHPKKGQETWLKKPEALYRLLLELDVSAPGSPETVKKSLQRRRAQKRPKGD